MAETPQHEGMTMAPTARLVINIPWAVVVKVDKYAALEAKRVPGLKLSRSIAASVLILEGLRSKLDTALAQVIAAEENGAPDAEEMRRAIEDVLAEMDGVKGLVSDIRENGRARRNGG